LLYCAELHYNQGGENAQTIGRKKTKAEGEIDQTKKEVVIKMLGGAVDTCRESVLLGKKALLVPRSLRKT